MQEKILGNSEMAKIGSPQFRIRLDEPLKRRLEEAGEAAGRSLNGEIEYRLVEYERQKRKIASQERMEAMKNDLKKDRELFRKKSDRMRLVNHLLMLKRALSHREELLSELREKEEESIIGYAEYEVLITKKEFVGWRNIFLERYGYDFTEEPKE